MNWDWWHAVYSSEWGNQGQTEVRLNCYPWVSQSLFQKYVETRHREILIQMSSET